MRGPMRTECRIGHHVCIEHRYERDARVFAPVAAGCRVRTSYVFTRFERETEPVERRIVAAGPLASTRPMRETLPTEPRSADTLAVCRRGCA